MRIYTDIEIEIIFKSNMTAIELLEVRETIEEIQPLSATNLKIYNIMMRHCIKSNSI